MKIETQYYTGLKQKNEKQPQKNKVLGTNYVQAWCYIFKTLLGIYVKILTPLTPKLLSLYTYHCVIYSEHLYLYWSLHKFSY